MSAAPDARSSASSTEPVADSRLRLGMENTLLIWIRTGLSLMGFGFVLARFGLFLEQIDTKHANASSMHISLWFGILLISLGVIVNLASAAMHRPYLQRARRLEKDLPGTWRLALALAVLSALAGGAMVVLLMAMEIWK